MKKLNCILLIDDDDLTNILNSLTIKKMDIATTVKVVMNGSEALEYLNAISEENPVPELIFLDINMPKMDGWEFLEEYRQEQLNKLNSKIILLTTSENPDDIEKALKYPEIQQYCSKPLNKAILTELMEKFFPS